MQEEVNGLENTAGDLLHIDFWDGMTSVDGYGAIRFFDSIFYKAPHRGSWENALTYNANQLLATFSRRFSNWDYASERVYVSPFSWIDDGPTAKPVRRRPLARVRGRAAARLSQVGHGRRVRQLRLRAAGGLRLLSPTCPRCRPARGRATSTASTPTLELTETARPDDRGHRARQPRDPGRALARRSRPIGRCQDELGGPGRRL